MPEIAGQQISGTNLSERDCYLQAVAGLRQASTALRGLALLRNDMRWLLPVRLLDEITDKVGKLMVRPGARLLILPTRMRM